jgi:hypothetical protein
MGPARITRWDISVILILGLLSLAHYTVSAHTLWIHAILFWLFQIPVLIGGCTRGVRGGLAVAAVTSAAFFPHALGLSRHHGLSANTIWMDLASLFIIGLTTGWLRDRWHRQMEMGERIRDLGNLNRILKALCGDLRAPVPAIRGLIVSLEPLKNRTPALAFAVHSMDRSLSRLEEVFEHLESFRIDQKMGYVRLDRILTAMQGHLRRIASPVPAVRIDWSCSPPMVPANVASLSSSLACLIMHLAPRAQEVGLRITRASNWTSLDIYCHETTDDEEPATFRPPLVSFEVACLVIQAHGGVVERMPVGSDARYLRVHIPTTIRVRPIPSGLDWRNGDSHSIPLHEAGDPLLDQQRRPIYVRRQVAAANPPFQPEG